MRNRSKRKKNEESLRDLWVTSNVSKYILRVPEGEKKDKGAERIFKEIMGENIPSLMKNINLHIQEAW